MSDIKELARQAAAGDRNAFDGLYEQTKKGVWFTCISLLKNEENAKDVMQETYLTAFEKLPALPNFDNVQGWLNKVAANKCKDRLRSGSGEQQGESGEALEDIPDGALFPEEYVMDKAKRAIITDIIENKLSEAQSRTIILYYFDEMTAAEIAELMGCHEKTVLYRLKTARLKIKEEVLKYEEENGDRLHVILPLPILTLLLRAAAEDTDVPSLSASAPPVSQDVPVNSAANAANSGGKTMLNSLKAKVIAGACAAVVVGGGVTAAVLIANNSKKDTEVFSRPYLSSQSTAGGYSKPSVSQSGTTSKSDTANSTPSNVNTEYPKIEGLTPVKLTRMGESGNNREPDIISGKIKDALLDEFLFLTEDGELVAYCKDGIGYQPISFGKDTGITNLDNAFIEVDGNEITLLAVDGKNVFYKVLDQNGEVKTCKDTGNAREIQGTLFGDRDDIRDIRVDAFQSVVAFDKDGLATELENRYRFSDERIVSKDALFGDDKEGFYYFSEYANGFYYNGMKVKQLANRCFIAEDNKIYYHRPGSSHASKTPIESLKEFSFESVYCPLACDQISKSLYSGVTDDGTIKVFDVTYEDNVKVVFSAPKPEGTIQNIWNVLGKKVVVKTDKGVYSADYKTDTAFKPDPSLNGIGEEVISISGYYVLLGNGCVYTIDGFRS